jgi:serine protease Do
LATIVVAEYTVNGKAVRGKVNELADYMDGYAAGFAQGEGVSYDDIPDKVASMRKLVVCISAESNGEPIQFSGFFVDEEGLILSTAHDLSNVSRITIILHDGRRLPGRIIKRDVALDLCLIDSGMRVEKAVSIKQSGTGVTSREKIYSIGCPLHEKEKFTEGVITGPPVIVDGSLLLRAEMETLPGGSGSPVFDAEGKLIGTVRGRYRGSPSQGFIIPVETLERFIENKWGY